MGLYRLPAAAVRTSERAGSPREKDGCPFRSRVVLDEYGDLWGWGLPFVPRLGWDENPPDWEADPDVFRRPAKMMSHVRDVSASLFAIGFVKDDGTL